MSDNEFGFEFGLEDEYEELPFLPPPPPPLVFEGGFDELLDEDVYEPLNLIIPVAEEIDFDDTSTFADIWEGYHDLWDFMSDSEAETVVEGWEGYME